MCHQQKSGSWTTLCKESFKWNRWFLFILKRGEKGEFEEIFITTWFDDNDEEKVTKASQDKATSRKTNQLFEGKRMKRLKEDAFVSVSKSQGAFLDVTQMMLSSREQTKENHESVLKSLAFYFNYY